jgi:hypothetical protein
MPERVVASNGRRISRDTHGVNILVSHDTGGA